VFPVSKFTTQFDDACNARQSGRSGMAAVMEMREQREKSTGQTMGAFRGGLVFKAHRLVYHSTLGLRVIKKKKKLLRFPLFLKLTQGRLLLYFVSLSSFVSVISAL